MCIALRPFGAIAGCWGTAISIGCTRAGRPRYDGVTASPAPGGTGSQPSGITTTRPVTTTTAPTQAATTRQVGRSQARTRGTASSAATATSTTGPSSMKARNATPSASVRWNLIARPPRRCGRCDAWDESSHHPPRPAGTSDAS